MYGYSPTTLQAGKDAKAHKENGNLGLCKVSHLLDKSGHKEANSRTLKDFVSENSRQYIEADKKGQKLFIDLLDYYKIKFLWSRKKENKKPDYFIKNRNEIYIVEHKHMKEGGGGQDKQINEVISFIGFSEKKTSIHYVSFLDGIYFNLFSNKKYLKKGKILSQLKNIKKNLKRNGRNYFVNTKGFVRLIS